MPTPFYLCNGLFWPETLGNVLFIGTQKNYWNLGMCLCFRVIQASVPVPVQSPTSCVTLAIPSKLSMCLLSQKERKR